MVAPLVRFPAFKWRFPGFKYRRQIISIRRDGCTSSIMSSNISEIGSHFKHRYDDDSQLNKTRKEALTRAHKLETVLNFLKNADSAQLQVNDKNRLKNMLKILAVQDCIHLSSTDKQLGLDNCDSLSLSYTERKALREYLFTAIRKDCAPAVEYFDFIQKEIPNVLEAGANLREILELDTNRRKLHGELIKIKSEKCELLKTCTELKLAPLEEMSLNVLLAESKLNQIKIETLHRFLIQEFCTRTQHATKAIREVERYIDEELEKFQE